jgi:hypothetical protein
MMKNLHKIYTEGEVMAWYWIVLLTVVGVHAVNTVIVLVQTERGKDTDDIVYLLALTVWMPLFIPAYPIRAIGTYNRASAYFQKRGISKIAYLFGKRVRKEQQ